mgnify:CR=1 FL=1
MKLTIKDGRDKFYTFDTNRILLLTEDDPSIEAIHFETDGDKAYVVDIKTDTETGQRYVIVPQSLLTGDYSRIVAFFYCEDSSGNYTSNKQVFRVVDRQEPEGYTLTEDERVTWETIKKQAEEYRDQAKDSQEKAKTSEENAKASEDSVSSMKASVEKSKSDLEEEIGTAYTEIESRKNASITAIDTKEKSSIKNVGDKETEVIANIEEEKNKAIISIGNKEQSSKDALSNLLTDCKTSLEQYKETKKEELNTHTTNKKNEINTYTDTKKSEINSLTETKKTEISEIYDEDLEDYKTEVNSRVDEIEGVVSKKVDSAEVKDGYLILYADGDVVAQLTGFGGGGGGGSTTTSILKVTNTTGYITRTISSQSDCILSFEWSSTMDDIPTGNGLMSLVINDKTIIPSKNIVQGSVSLNVAEYLNSNSTNKVVFTVTDIYENKRVIRFTIKVIEYSITSTFSESDIQSGAFSYYFTPVGEGTKTLHVKLDGTEIITKETATNKRQEIVSIPAQTHGTHDLEVWFDVTLNGETISSNILKYNIICTTSGNTDTIISLRTKSNKLKQYYANDITYQVWTASQSANVTLNDGSTSITLQNIGITEQVWSITKNELGTYTLSVSANGKTVSKQVEVVSSGIVLNPATTGLELYLTSKSHVVGSALEWKYNNINCTFTGFRGTADGWQFDKDNIPVLRLIDDARLVIPFKPFNKEISVNGKTIEFEFSTSNVFDYDSVVIDCMSGGRGLKATAQAVTLSSSENSLYTQYKEDEHVRISFVISASTDISQGKIVYCYINGIMSGAYKYSTDFFEQVSPVNITIGSNGCTTDIYSIRIYDRALTRYEIVDNWLADIQKGSELITEYNSNDIYENDIVTEEKLLSVGLPCLVIEGTLPKDKGDKKTVSGRYTDPLNSNKSFTFENATIDIQGTSSKDYPRKNYKIKFKGGFTTASGTVSTYAINNGIPVDTFTFKADYASSEGANNVELVRLYNDLSTYRTPPQVTDSRVRQGIEGFPIAIFHGSTFVGKYNFNNDKGTAEVYGFSTGDESWEITGNGSDRQLFKKADFNSYDEVRADFESRYPDDESPDVNITKLKSMISWVASTDTTVSGLSESEKTARLTKFKNEFTNYFDKDSTFFYYLFTEMFLMVDSRAKNAFPSIFTETEKWCWLPYDMDTALGIDNGGRLMFSYNLEDTDLVDGHYVYNGQASVLWNNLRVCFADELEKFYTDKMRNSDLFTYESIEERFENHQNKWAVSLWNEDAYYKYIEPLLETNEDRLYMCQGSKEEQRKWWLYNRFRYIDSKYGAGSAKQKTIVFRAYSNNNTNYSTFKITPYADIYARVEFDEKKATQKAIRNQEVQLTIEGIENPNNLVVRIYSADQLASIGDISGFLPDEVNITMAENLQSIKVGDSTEGYTNPNLKALTLGANKLLKTIDARNCTALNTSIDASGCQSLLTAYFDNTQIPSIAISNGCAISTLHLPSSIVSLELRNLSNLTDLTIAGYSNLSRVWIENPSSYVMTLVYPIITGLSNGTRVRIKGLNITVNSESEINTFFSKFDNLKGLDAYGQPNEEVAQLSGVINIDTMTYDRKNEIETQYPMFTINATHLKCSVKFYSADGSELLYSSLVDYGSSATYGGTTQTKPSTAQYIYTFEGWSTTPNSEVPIANILDSVSSNIEVYAVFSKTVRSYTVKFINESYSPAQVLQSSTYEYGSLPVYSGSTPIYNPNADDKEDWGDFKSWDKEITTVVEDTTYKAKFISLSSMTKKLIAKSLRRVEDDTVTSLGYCAFAYCTSLTSVSFPNATSINKIDTGSVTGLGTFAHCTSLTSVSFPNATNTGYGAFSYCRGLTSISLPKVTTVGNSAFYGCSKLTNVDIPNAITINSYAFSSCLKLVEVSFPNVTSINGHDVFSDATTTMYIGTETDTVCTLEKASAIPSRVTDIYVPSALVEQYKTATNWSNFADKIKAYTGEIA